LKILLAASEIVPFAKTGGLADVTGALPLSFEALKHEIVVAMPKYSCIDTKALMMSKSAVGIQSSLIGKKSRVYFIENDRYYNRKYLYGESHGDYPDNLDRFAYFCRRTLDLLKEINFKPDIIHCHDWQTALIPVFLKTIYKKDPFYSDIKTVITVHNLGYQGVFSKDEFSKLGLDWGLFGIDGLEFYGNVNVLKGGLVFVDAITTVSETYAKEIQTEELGCGLEGLLKKRKENIFGIINGIDYNLWNPEKDTQLAKVYKPGSVDGKHINKEKLQKECSLPVKKDVPILGVVSRLAEQKGTDILVESLEDILKLNVQVVVLGTGDIRYHKILEKISRKHSLKMSLFLKFDDRLAHNIYAGSDIFLMPSKYEPCGLGQMIALRYGSIPVVFKTGGLADTIIDLKNKKGNGFVFSIYSKKELLSTVERAINAYHKPIWQDLVKEAIGIRFSWDKSAKKYINLFEKIRK